MSRYEMRISDLGSDVCSSDLVRRRPWHRGCAARHAGPKSRQAGDRSLGRGIRRAADGGGLWRDQGGADQHGGGDEADRKSGVSGKSVAGRVDLGGRRIMKKKETIA